MFNIISRRLQIVVTTCMLTHFEVLFINIVFYLGFNIPTLKLYQFLFRPIYIIFLYKFSHPDIINIPVSILSIYKIIRNFVPRHQFLLIDRLYHSNFRTSTLSIFRFLFIKIVFYTNFSISI